MSDYEHARNKRKNRKSQQGNRSYKKKPNAN